MRFVHESIIAAPVSRVFAFHEAPDALERLVPPWETVQLVQRGGSLAPGTRVVMRTRIGPLWVTWEAEHTRLEKDVLFQDRQVRGPFRAWLHTHRFFPTPEGHTRLVDEIDCEPPLGLLGRVFGEPIVRARLLRMFRFRHEVTRAACEAPR
ncbi:MAG: SRPBCC family protein [Deltaproteobacteria bacterium]|nr:SRPBCC family protein [Deltaproteobacteria bacterium]